jgi:transposase-like protein
VILCAVRWYLRYSLSLRDVEELLTERGERRKIVQIVQVLMKKIARLG